MVSLSTQTFSDFEVLIFDDGSSDDTRSIVERFIEQDDRFHLQGSDRVGLVEALNRTISTSNAEFLARIDGDDISRPDRLRLQVDFLDANPHILAVGCLVNSFSSAGVGLGMQRYTEWLNTVVSAEEIERALFVESPLCHPSVTMRRSAFEQSIGYVDDGRPEDYHLWLDFFARGFQMAKVPAVLLDWRDRRDRLSRTDMRYSDDKFLSLKIEYLEKTMLKNHPTVGIWGAGKIGRRLSRSLSSHGFEVAEFIDIDPNKIGRHVHGRKVIPAPDSLSDLSSDVVLVAVGSPFAREKISRLLTDIGLEPCRWTAVA
jgi:glycosyltransferase involved in cell wall biosynthesis